MALNLLWNKCDGGKWCKLLELNLEDQHFDDMKGVYIIWHAGENSATVRVGQGFIRERLAAHKEEPEILEYRPYTLYVTWAQVATNQCDGVECYLAGKLNPKVGSRFPDTEPIEVNSPWQE